MSLELKVKHALGELTVANLALQMERDMLAGKLAKAEERIAQLEADSKQLKVRVCKTAQITTPHTEPCPSL